MTEFMFLIFLNLERLLQYHSSLKMKKSEVPKQFLRSSSITCKCCNSATPSFSNFKKSLALLFYLVSIYI